MIWIEIDRTDLFKSLVMMEETFNDKPKAAENSAAFCGLVFESQSKSRVPLSDQPITESTGTLCFHELLSFCLYASPYFKLDPSLIPDVTL